MPAVAATVLPAVAARFWQRLSAAAARAAAADAGAEAWVTTGFLNLDGRQSSYLPLSRESL